MFCSDYPRDLANGLWFWWFPSPHPLPVATALAVPFLLAGRRLPVSLLRLPPRPFPRRLPARFAAIPLVRLSRMKTQLATLEQTTPPPRSAGQSLPPTFLIFGMACRTLGRAHGRCHSQKLRPWRGISILSRAQQTSGSQQINTVTENCGGVSRAPPPLASPLRGSATDGLGHCWKAGLGHFSQAPKASGLEREAILQRDHDDRRSAR